MPPLRPFDAPPPNLQLVGTGVPTCTQIMDVVTLGAAASSPALHAETQAYVLALPGPAGCPVVDVAAMHAQQTTVVSGSNRLTYTLTISNLISTAVNGVIQQTITPTTAIKGAELPTGCTRAANVVTCQISDIAAQGAKSVVGDDSRPGRVQR